jgi:hypothetical protein
MGFRILQSLGFAAMLFLAATIVVGKTKAGRLVLTRRRWKYFTLIGLFIAVIITFVVAAPNLDRPWANSVLSVFPLVLGGFVAQLYEPESTAQCQNLEENLPCAGPHRSYHRVHRRYRRSDGEYRSVRAAVADWIALPGLRVCYLDDASEKESAAGRETLGGSLHEEMSRSRFPKRNGVTRSAGFYRS